MVKILRVEPRADRVLRLTFSDDTVGDFDLRPLMTRATAMVAPLEEVAFFQSWFLELGALCWPNGFALSAGGIQARLRERGQLHPLTAPI